MFELPMLRVDKKEYLERLQSGEFYMRNNLYYQALDSTDSVRSDPYDGSVPTDIASPFTSLSLSSVDNPRIIMGNTFVKCFFHCKQQDCATLNEYAYVLRLSDNARKELEEFATSHALLVLQPSQFIQQISDACADKELKLWYSDVEYLTQEDLKKESASFISGQSMRHPAFFKDVKYKAQQEFRICISYPYEHISPTDNNGVFYIDKEVVNETYTLNIGSIADISCIIPVSELLKYPIGVDVKNKVFCVFSEEPYENDEG